MFELGSETLLDWFIHDVLPPNVRVQRDGVLLRPHLRERPLLRQSVHREHHRGRHPPRLLLRGPGRGVADGQEAHPRHVHLRDVRLQHHPRYLLLSSRHKHW